MTKEQAVIFAVQQLRAKSKDPNLSRLQVYIQNDSYGDKMEADKWYVIVDQNTRVKKLEEPKHGQDENTGATPGDLA